MLFPEPSSFELVQFFTLVLHLQIKMEKINDKLIHCTSLSKLHVLSSILRIVVTVHNNFSCLQSQIHPCTSYSCTTLIVLFLQLPLALQTRKIVMNSKAVTTIRSVLLSTCSFIFDRLVQYIKLSLIFSIFI